MDPEVAARDGRGWRQREPGREAGGAARLRPRGEGGIGEGGRRAAGGWGGSGAGEGEVDGGGEGRRGRGWSTGPPKGHLRATWGQAL